VCTTSLCVDSVKLYSKLGQAKCVHVYADWRTSSTVQVYKLTAQHYNWAKQGVCTRSLQKSMLRTRSVVLINDDSVQRLLEARINSSTTVPSKVCVPHVMAKD
jgi:hypothetical protein